MTKRYSPASDIERALSRARRHYELRGYPRPWIDQRLRGVAARHEVTRQWAGRGANESDQYRALTNELVRETFGLDVNAYRQHKGLTTGSLRDHMDDAELALTVLGETVATILHRQRDSQGFDQLVADARDAGQVAAEARRALEARLGRPVLSPSNRVGLTAAPRPRLSA